MPSLRPRPALAVTGMLLKGALHVHTTCSDGRLGVASMLRVYQGLGFDFVALTDHDHLLRDGCYREALAAVETELLVFEGVELTVFEKGYLHVNRIRCDREVLHVLNHPADLGLSLAKLGERVEALRARGLLDAIEVTTKGIYAPEIDQDALPYPKLASDDAHDENACGRAWIEMDCRRDRDAILLGIKQGEFWNCYRGGAGRRGP
jgi:predicted metal-dependent phosphoesterase TrpH